jgi:hypothetical protein
VIQLLERVAGRKFGKEIRETNISAWRRTVCGNLSAAFRPFDRNRAGIGFPSRDSFFELVYHRWYDFNVTIAGVDPFLRRLAGRVETGKSGFSDPVMGRAGIS